jgi:hypothetical protein
MYEQSLLSLYCYTMLVLLLLQLPYTQCLLNRGVCKANLV